MRMAFFVLARIRTFPPGLGSDHQSADKETESKAFEQGYSAASGYLPRYITKWLPPITFA